MPGSSPPGMTQESDDQRAGNAAHWLASEALRGNIADVYEYADRKAPNGHYIDADILDNVTFYLDAVSKRPTYRMIEQPMSFNVGDVTINCRPDMVSIGQNPRRVYIDDYKNGWDIVEAKENWTLLGYAFNFLGSADPDTLFTMSIHQPRPYHPLGRSRSWTIDAMTLHTYWQEFNARIADVSTLQTGPSCYKCPARANCPALRKAAFHALEMSEAALPEDLPPDELSYLADALSVAQKRLDDYADAIKERIGEKIASGVAVRNYVMQPTEGKLAWVDGITADTLRILAPGKIVSKETMITPTQAKKILPEAIIKTLSERKPGGLILVRRDANELAQQLFNKRSE